jgi:hypothetical protein
MPRSYLEDNRRYKQFRGVLQGRLRRDDNIVESWGFSYGNGN